MISIGTRLGSYQIISLLGQGGMGEVYRATDTKLNRDVALKFLPAQFTGEPDRIERFQREAYVLASLNHSNIAAIYGFEDSNSIRALVMEFVEGPTLADRIAQGSIPIDEVLSIGKQIAEALEYAHERGVIHRDLKPANINLTLDGKVKVLDFGLAKALNGESQSSTMSNSPTLSLAATQAGVILGTAAYMSPEQAKGKPVDRRADIWAFGVVVYEMLTGKRMFGGETTSETMAQVMMMEPDWTLLPAGTPARLRDLLRRCLTKDPRNRVRDIGDVRITIEEAIAQPEPQTAATMASPSSTVVSRRSAAPWIVVAVLALSLVLVVWAPWNQRQPVSVMRLTSEVGADGSLVTGVGAAAFLSPDGKTLAFLASKATDQQAKLYVRHLDQLEASALNGTEGARNAFFSPDGQWIAFFADAKLKKISVNGGAAVTLCDAENDRGGSWADDGSIVFAPSTRTGLSRVSSAGGKPEPITKLDQGSGEITQRWPQVLPGSQAVVFISSSMANNYEDANIVVQTISTGARKVLQHGYYPHYVPSGHLLYMHMRTLFAVPFDLKRLEISGQPVPVVENVTNSSFNGASEFALSQTGALIYLAGDFTTTGTSVSWLTSDGKIQPLRAEIATYLNPRFSPDGRRIAFEMVEQQYDVWIYEWERGTMSRLTFDAYQDAYPVWSPDGRRIVFGSQRADKSTFNLYWQRADGTGEPQRLTDSKNQQHPMSWHPSGKLLAFTELNPNSSIMILPMDGDEASGWKPGKPTVFLQTRFNEYDPAFSPDGRWIAYRSTESGTSEVYVRPFPGPGGKWQISTGGGWFPTWSENGKNLFFRTADSKIMSASYKVERDTFIADKPQSWSDVQFTDRNDSRNFDLHPDGKRFAILTAPPQSETKRDKITFIFNFFDELRRVAPVQK